MKKKEQNKDFELGQQIAEMRGEMTEGFKGVYARQDKTNGRLGKHDEEIAFLLSKLNQSKGFRAGLSLYSKILVAILTLLIAALALFAASGCWAIVCHK